VRQHEAGLRATTPWQAAITPQYVTVNVIGSVHIPVAWMIDSRFSAQSRDKPRPDLTRRRHPRGL
jgi:hypothetical protein